ncbi:MAG: membrane protein insertion efficiency factor YidD [Candidatus Methylomirabilia bacterium]
MRGTGTGGSRAVWGSPSRDAISLQSCRPVREGGPRTLSAIALGAAWLLRGYQLLLSPMLPRACRYEPTCSEYARQALLLHGPGRGVWLALKRFGRCHPFRPGGFDPPPPRARGTPA